MHRWISIKNRLTYITKQYAKELAQLKREQLHYYYTRLHNLALRLHSQPDLLPEVKLAQAEIKRLYAQQIQGIIVRSRLPDIAGMEASLLHVREEKKRHSNTFINEYSSQRGDKYKGDQIYQVIYTEFCTQFQDFTSTPNYEEFLTDEIPTLSSDQANTLLTAVTEQELKTAIQSLNVTASPGLDGLSPHWYLAFSNDLSTFLLSMYNDLFSQQNIPLVFAQIQGILIPKKCNPFL
jgi:hypothetical protein